MRKKNNRGDICELSMGNIVNKLSFDVYKYFISKLSTSFGKKISSSRYLENIATRKIYIFITGEKKKNWNLFSLSL